MGNELLSGQTNVLHHLRFLQMVKIDDDDDDDSGNSKIVIELHIFWVFPNCFMMRIKFKIRPKIFFV